MVPEISEPPDSGWHKRYYGSPEKRLEDMLEDAGAVEIRSNKHRIFRLPNGKQLTMPKTPSDRRGYMNTISNLRRLM